MQKHIILLILGGLLGARMGMAQAPTTKLPFTDFLPNGARTEAGRWRILNTDGTVAITLQGQATPSSVANLTGGIASQSSFSIMDATFASTRLSISASGVLLRDNSGNLTVALGRTSRTVEMYEDPANGTNYIAMQAADSTTSTYTVKWPAAQGTGVLTNDGSGNLSWAAGGGALPVSDSTIITQGSGDATKQFRIENDTNIGAGTTVVGTVPSASFTFAGLELAQTFTAQQSITNNTAGSNPLVLRNNSATGLVGVGMINNAGAAKATFSWDNSGGFFRIETFGADKIQFRTNSTDRMYIDGGGLRPSTANTLDMGASSLYWVNNWNLRAYAEEFKVVVTGGAALGFGTAWDLTATSGGANWMRIRDNAAGDYAYFTTAGIFGGGVREAVWYANLDPDANNTRDLGISGRRWKKAWLVDVDISGSCTGCGGAPPFIDSTAIIKGSADATKLLAFEVDGFSTATTRTLTPQNASYTIAGINLSQTFTATQNFQQINPSSGNTYDNGTTSLYWKDYFGTRVYAEEIRPTRAGTSFGSSWKITNPFANVLYVQDEVGTTVLSLDTSLATDYAVFAANVYPNGTQDMGASGGRWNKIWATSIDVTNTIPGHVPTSRNVNTSSPLGGGGALSGDLTLTCTTCVTTGSTSSMGGNYTITGNLYIRTFSGGNANCTGVADGWIGFRTDTDEIQMCRGGALKKVTLL